MNTPESGSNKLSQELRLIGLRAREAWKMVPRPHQWALLGAATLMALASASATAIPLLLGYLVDGVKTATEQSAAHDWLFHFAAMCLAGITALVLLREGINVLRRFLVENTCT